MNPSIHKKIKKYVLYISTVFFLVFGLHIGYTYLYDWAESIPEEWGTISEAIIWSFPHLNPLLPSNDHNAYINGLLYRSMLEYSTKSEWFESDLVSCSLEDLLYIECILENNLRWSDGSPITTEDIKATFNIISKTKVNPIIASLLENTVIETTEDSISFSNSNKDINFLHIFLQPILPASVIEELDSENIEGKFSEINGIYSWRFVLSNISQDETIGITKITFWKNEQYFWNPLFINFLILNLFRDEAHFLKNKNSFNIFNDKSTIVGESIPRLKKYPYTLSQFVWVFFNTETLAWELRPILSSAIEREDYISGIWESNILPAYNPFLSSTNIDSRDDPIDITKFLSGKAYYSKTDLLKDALLWEEAESITNTPLVSEEASPAQVQEVKRQEDLNYVNSPTNKKYSFVSEDNILVSWRVDNWVDAVYINDYKLTGYSAGESIFYYRLSESFETIEQWENTYTIYFEVDGEKKEIETFVYIYNTDTEALEKIESEYFSQVETSEENTSSEQENTESYKRISDLSSAEIGELDDRFYYDTDGNPRSIRVLYSQNDNYMAQSALILKEQIESIGIKVNLESKDLGDITVGLRNETLEYDMMLLWINLWYFSSNIFPYFHSSQIKNGYNIANFKKLSLDILLEELKSNNLSVEKREELEEKMLDIMREESVVKVLYTPNISLLVDRNIKNFSLPAYLPDEKHRSFPLTDSYLSEKKIINSENKWFFGFIRYIFSNLLKLPNE